jgi:acid phosphatase (class A)
VTAVPPNARAIALAALGAFGALAVAAWAQPGGIGQGAPSAETAPAELPPGYLPRAELPDSLALLPPPPAERSAAFARDQEARATIAGLRGSARWTLASADAVLAFPQAAQTFSCAAGVAIGPESTPGLTRLLGRMLIDVGLSTYAAKDYYGRTRPFVVHDAGSCTPGDEAMLRGDGSYPSGHSAAGWGWALVLAELDPAHADAILQRGREFGQSRLVCDVHWQSDIDAGRVVAAATVARLHADAQFRADLEAARTELLGVHDAHVKPETDCVAEAATLALD